MRCVPFMGLLVGFLCASALAQEIPIHDRRSSYHQMLPETRAIQDDDTSNPGMLWVLEGATTWLEKAGTAAKSCADCHGEAEKSMRGVAARYPALDAKRSTVINLETRIDLCRREQQMAPPLPYESKPILGLTAYVAKQSRGLPISIDKAGLATAIAQGRALYLQRQGQLNLSCANCHDENWGHKLAGNTIPQGHPTGYPVYRLEWQTLGSLQRRLRNCLTGMRAENYEFGSSELTALESYLMMRAQGMIIESPGVRP